MELNLVEFLIIWFLSNDIIDSGLRFSTAEECYAEALNVGSELNSINLLTPKFTCIPLAKGKEFKIYRSNSNSRFPF